MKKIGFIGIGIMGNPMALHLINAGYEVSVYTRTKAKAKEVLEKGAHWCSSVKECVSGQEAVITIIGSPKDVKEVYYGADGILCNASAGTYLVDMTTTDPRLAVEIYKEAKSKNLYALDAPVTGGDKGAKEGTLTILVGGEKEAFTACLPLFRVMGRTAIYEGQAGNGQHTKMCNQIAVAGTVAGICEAVAYARDAGLDAELMIQTLASGAAGSFQMDHLAPKVLQNDFTPGFFIKHFIKDMSLAYEEAAEMGLKLNMLEQVLSMYRKLDEEGMGEMGMQALIHHYDRR